MQQRHIDRRSYFDESAKSSRDFYIDYIRKFRRVDAGARVLEIGCGEGGNLLPFAQIGCNITGIDCSEIKVENAKKFAKQEGIEGRFDTINLFDMNRSKYGEYDIILIHDVIEHIGDKGALLNHIKQFVAKDGIIFFGFPAWQMPFGGHQQVCRSRVCSKLPFIHLLPNIIYKGVLEMCGESNSCIEELLDIKSCRLSIEGFEKLIDQNGFNITGRYLWFINPHYQQKFNLKPRKLCNKIAKIKYIRNFFTTSCFYIVQIRD